MIRSASATWQGDLKAGKGTISMESGALDAQPFGFNTRFEDEPGTNPEELIGAAHAGCFSMAFANELSSRGLTVKDIQTKCDITLEKTDDGFTITKSTLTVDVSAEGDHDKFAEALHAAETGCPVSKLLDCEIVVNHTRQ